MLSKRPSGRLRCRAGGAAGWWNSLKRTHIESISATYVFERRARYRSHVGGLARLRCRAGDAAGTLLCRAGGAAGMWRARYRSLHVGQEHSPLQSTLLCRALSFAEHASLQSTLLCRARFFAEHASLQSPFLCRFFAEHASLQSTLLWSTLLCRAPLQSTLLCRAHFFAEHSPLRGWRQVSFGREVKYFLFVKTHN